MDVVVRRIPSPHQELNPRTPIVQPVAKIQIRNAYLVFILAVLLKKLGLKILIDFIFVANYSSELRFSGVCNILLVVIPCHNGMACPQVADGGYSLQIWRVAATLHGITTQKTLT
jgi:hypothetical protein